MQNPIPEVVSVIIVDWWKLMIPSSSSLLHRVLVLHDYDSDSLSLSFHNIGFVGFVRITLLN